MLAEEMRKVHTVNSELFEKMMKLFEDKEASAINIGFPKINQPDTMNLFKVEIPQSHMNHNHFLGFNTNQLYSGSLQLISGYLIRLKLELPKCDGETKP